MINKFLTVLIDGENSNTTCFLLEYYIVIYNFLTASMDGVNSNTTKNL
jgi:hypothetical protein